MRPTLAMSCALTAALACPWAQSRPPEIARPPLQRVERDRLCVTNGVISALPNGWLAVDTPSSRAVVRSITAQVAEIRFRYLGPSARSKPLASGALRRQIGLKLRAQDTCNLLYAMWHIAPDSHIAVAIKHNPGKHTHAQCHAGGYVPIRARTRVELPRVRPGESHTLRAELDGTALTLVADGRVVWEGTVGSAIAEFDGPVGLRTDNARFELKYDAPMLGPPARAKPLDEGGNHCLASPGD